MPPFRTVAEIEAILARGGLGGEEASRLWDCLYLTTAEIAGLLQTVRERSREDYAPLLHEIPAYTGMHRGEVIRLRWTDIEFDQGRIIARSLKQSRRTIEVARRIDLHPELELRLRRWRDRRPFGQYDVCEEGEANPLDPDLANRSFWQPIRGTGWCLKSKSYNRKLWMAV